MSQHHFPTTFEGRPVTIVMGWDRPLRGYFCFVERADSGDNEEEFVYCNLDDAALASGMGFAKAVEYFDALLVTRGLQVPRAMLAEVGRDGELDVGNRQVWYDASGVMVPSGAHRR